MRPRGERNAFQRNEKAINLVKTPEIHLVKATFCDGCNAIDIPQEETELSRLIRREGHPLGAVDKRHGQVFLGRNVVAKWSPAMIFKDEHSKTEIMLDVHQV